MCGHGPGVSTGEDVDIALVEGDGVDFEEDLAWGKGVQGLSVKVEGVF